MKYKHRERHHSINLVSSQEVGTGFEVFMKLHFHVVHPSGLLFTQDAGLSVPETYNLKFLRQRAQGSKMSKSSDQERG